MQLDERAARFDSPEPPVDLRTGDDRARHLAAVDGAWRAAGLLHRAGAGARARPGRHLPGAPGCPALGRRPRRLRRGRPDRLGGDRIRAAPHRAPDDGVHRAPAGARCVGRRHRAWDGRVVRGPPAAPPSCGRRSTRRSRPAARRSPTCSADCSHPRSALCCVRPPSCLGLIVIPVWLFYVLKDREGFTRSVARALPPSWRPDAENLLALLGRVGGRWVRGQLLLGASIFLATAIGLTILTVIGFSEFGQFTLVLALIAGAARVRPDHRADHLGGAGDPDRPVDLVPGGRRGGIAVHRDPAAREQPPGAEGARRCDRAASGGHDPGARRRRGALRDRRRDSRRTRRSRWTRPVSLRLPSARRTAAVSCLRARTSRRAPHAAGRGAAALRSAHRRARARGGVA